MWVQHPFLLEQAAKAQYENLLQEAEIDRMMRSQQQGSNLKQARFRRLLVSLLIVVGQKLQDPWGSLPLLSKPAACGCCQGAR